MPKFQVQSANTSAIVAQCATVTPLALKRPVYNDSRHPTGAEKAGVQRDLAPAGGSTPSLHPSQPVYTG